MVSSLHSSVARSAPFVAPVRAVQEQALAVVAGQDESDNAKRDEAVATPPKARTQRDSVELSGPGLEALAREEEPSAAGASDETELSEEERSSVRDLKARDSEVRAHEAAHLSAAGSLATGGASYDYQRGPDGVSYAVGGEVGIRVGGGSTPEERMSNAARAQRAANAPAKPSGQDRSVAASASKMVASARSEIAEQRAEEAQVRTEEQGSVSSASQAPGSVPASSPTDATETATSSPQDPAQAAQPSAVEQRQDVDNSQRDAARERRADAYAEVTGPAPEISNLLGELFG